MGYNIDHGEIQKNKNCIENYIRSLNHIEENLYVKVVKECHYTKWKQIYEELNQVYLYKYWWYCIFFFINNCGVLIEILNRIHNNTNKQIKSITVKFNHQNLLQVLKLKEDVLEQKI